MNSTVSKKGQITIPKSIRDELGLKPGDRVSLVKNPAGKYELRCEGASVAKLRGSLSYSGPPLSIVDMDVVIAGTISDAML